MGLFGKTITVPARLPRPLAIYYGWPSCVNRCRSIDAAAEDLARFDTVVLGEGLESSAHPDHENTRAIVARLTARGVSVLGYVAIGNLDASAALSIADISEHSRRWVEDVGATAIFLDECGTDYNVSRKRVSDAAAGARRAGAKGVFFNGWQPKELLSLVKQSGDAYVLESFLIERGEVQDPTLFTRRAMQSASSAGAWGAQADRVACIPTMGRLEPATASRSRGAESAKVEQQGHPSPSVCAAALCAASAAMFGFGWLAAGEFDYGSGEPRLSSTVPDALSLLRETPGGALLFGSSSTDPGAAPLVFTSPAQESSRGVVVRGGDGFRVEHDIASGTVLLFLDDARQQGPLLVASLHPSNY